MDKNIKVIPPKAGENQCRVIPPTEFADKRVADKISWTNRTGASMTVLVKKGLFGNAAVSEVVADGQTSSLMTISGDAPSGVNTYNVWCEATNNLAKGGSEPEIVVEP